MLCFFDFFIGYGKKCEFDGNITVDEVAFTAAVVTTRYAAAVVVFPDKMKKKKKKFELKRWLFPEEKSLSKTVLAIRVTICEPSFFIAFGV